MTKILYIFCLLLYSVTIISEETTSTVSSTNQDSSQSSTITSSITIVSSTTDDVATTTSTTVGFSTIESSAVTESSTTIASSTIKSTITEETTKTESSTAASTTTEESTITESSTAQSSTTPIPITSIIIAQRSFTWSSSDLSNNNPIVIEVEEGYYISVKVSDVDMSDGNYLLLQGGNSDNLQSEDRRIFTNTVKGPVTYLYLTSKIYAFCENTKPKPDGSRAEFTVVFERVGELTSTISTTTSTTISVPTTEKEDSTEITVNLAGRNLVDFEDINVRETFQSCVAQIAKNYCKQQNIPLTQNITQQYVIISKIDQCPYDWPHSSKCVQITFRLPIFYETTNKWSGYQLNSENLEIMWLRKDELNSDCLYDNNFDDYDDPNFKRSIIWWAVGITLVIIFFVALLWFLRTFSSKLKAAYKKRQRKNSDTVSIMSRKTDSVCSLTPHYLQDRLEVPKIFEP